MKYNPHDYQIYAINFIKEHPIAAILLDMGMGKTSIVLAALNFMDFSLLRAVEFFVFRKRELPKTKIHLLCGWRRMVIQKITFPLQ